MWGTVSRSFVLCVMHAASKDAVRCNGDESKGAHLTSRSNGLRIMIIVKTLVGGLLTSFAAAAMSSDA